MWPYSDEAVDKACEEQMVGHPYDLLLGRKTYDIFAPYWPQHTDHPIGAAFATATKYVATRSSVDPSWEKTVVLQGDVVEAVRKLKADGGPELQVHGSADFVQTLLKHDLVDELWLKIFPITLGPGKRLFEGGAIPAAFRMTKHEVGPKGTIVANFARAGEVKTMSTAEVLKQ
jgi:dihydrofolate reductase